MAVTGVWVESDIKNDADIKALRKYCEYVYVDVLRGVPPSADSALNKKWRSQPGDEEIEARIFGELGGKGYGPPRFVGFDLGSGATASKGLRQIDIAAYLAAVVRILEAARK